MATSLLLWTSSTTTEGEKLENNVISGQQEMRPVETAKQRGRRGGKSNGPTQKKQPQRGLGIQQLERLRMQEGRKKTDPVQAHNLQQQQFQFQIPFQFTDHQIGVPAQFTRFGPMNYGVPLSDSQYSQDFLSHPHGVGNCGSLVPSGGSGAQPIFADQFQVDRYRITPQLPMFQSENPFETAKELSSTQKMHCLSDRCEMCVKKKRINGENLGFNAGMGKYADINSDSLRLKLGCNGTIDGGSRDMAVKGISRAGYSGLNAEQEVELIAFQRKGKSVGGGLLMEYEFFPRMGGNGNNVNYNDFSVAESTAAAQPVLVSKASPSSANFLDLSLKLSC